MLTQGDKGTDTLYFTYDAVGAPTAVTYNGTTYYYVTNLQGDIVAILDSTGTSVVNYTYDAWGNPLSRTGTMKDTLGILNPLRYRGYVYDQETRLYYLQSRYYNPEIGRFISADAFVSTGQGFVGNNMFAYCGNNPVNRVDRNGKFWDYVIDIGFLVWSVADVVNDPSDWKNWLGLAVDVVFAVAPFVPSGVGQVIKVGDGISDGIKVAQKATVVGETMNRVGDFAKGIGAADNLYNGFKYYDNLSNLGKVGKVAAEVAGKTSNVAWLYKKLRTGYTVYDIGVDVNRALRSSSYIVEKTTLFLWENRRLWKFGVHLALEG